MNFFDFYSMHPVGYSIVLLFALVIIFDAIVEIFKAIGRRRR